jgi:predicted transglutaminase-like cysteine proteinase
LHPDKPADGPPAIIPRLAALEPAHLPIREPAPPVGPEPFGLSAMDSGSYAARWRLLQPLIAVEHRVLALCHSTPSACTPAAAKFGAIVEAAQHRSGLARIGEVNRAVNLAIRPMSDLAQYGAADIWASPLMTFGSGAGDCEDYAIAKYVALREAGMAADDLRLVVVYNRPAHENHMVAAARVEGRWLILDNRTMMLVADKEIADLTPLALLDSTDPSPTLAAMPSSQAVEASAESWDTAGFTAEL